MLARRRRGGDLSLTLSLSLSLTLTLTLALSLSLTLTLYEVATVQRVGALLALEPAARPLLLVLKAWLLPLTLTP